MESDDNVPSVETSLDEWWWRRHSSNLDTGPYSIRASSLSSTGSDMASVFGMLLSESKLRGEADQDDNALAVTMAERKVSEPDQ